MSVIKAIEFPNKTFSTKEELYSELVKNASKIIDLKKSAVYKSCEKKGISILTFKSDIENKAFKIDTGYFYPVISTTNYFDSHGDVHFKGCFNKTVKDQQGSVFYTADHDLSLNSIIAWKDDVEMFVKDIEWSLVGKEYSGTTNALIFKINIDAVRNEAAYSLIDERKDVENSIRMRYITIKLGMNSDAPENKAYKQYYDSKIKEIVNSDQVAAAGYFWGVEELAIYKEGSLVVCGGSNDATAIIYDNTEAGKSATSDSEALQALEKAKQAKKQLIKNHLISY